MEARYVAAQGKALLEEAVALLGQGKAEDVLRHALSAKLPLMFPEQPWWTRAHVTGAEALATFSDESDEKRGFVDVLVGATVIEYERDLRRRGVFEHGKHQLKQYLAARLNAGTPPDRLVGVLSDTVRWYAFGVASIAGASEVAGAGGYGPEHVGLIEIDACDLSSATDADARKLGAFLVRHLGREGGRPLTATTLANDLGFRSRFCQEHLRLIERLVDRAFTSNPSYAALITKLWTDFVSYLGGDTAAGGFDRGSYVGELYILTLAKLICANVLSGRALISEGAELRAILDGSFFKARGLPNLVEYDYFGWINADPNIAELAAVARDIQFDLRAYDFVATPVEDLFGALMAQLAGRSQRLLLGQEATPAWLAGRVVEHVMASLTNGEQPHFLDMCCGSGSMVVETVKRVQQQLQAAGCTPGDPEALRKLVAAITAFDIDPLAVLLAKVGWVLATKSWLAPGLEAQIPVYHADSLFVNTPVTKVFGPTGDEQRKLRLDTEEVLLPQFLLESSRQALFDALLSRGYAMAMMSAAAPATTLTDADIETMVDAVVVETGLALEADERLASSEFSRELLRALENLQRAGRNGIWAFVLRNAFRPTLVAGRFNGVVTNPPWLALSRIASNPYQEALKSLADLYGIRAPGASHLHVEIATIFLLHAIDRYLSPGAVVGCILPDTVLNGMHHEPFRSAGYLGARRSVEFSPREIWKVASQTFKNEAIVLFGSRTQPSAMATYRGREVSRVSETSTTYHRVSSNGRTAWTTTPAAVPAAEVGTANSVGPLFKQGADVMPRSVVFHEVTRAGAAWNLGPIRAGSPLYFLRADAHRLKEFGLTAIGVSDQVMFDVLISKHLAPFELAAGAKGLLPFEHGARGWGVRSGPGVAALGAATGEAISGALAACGLTIEEFFEAVDTDRRKLSCQIWGDDDWLVFASAGGKLPCAAYVRGIRIPCDRTIVDQTLYWGKCASEDEAVYIAALINSPAVNDVIREHQPRGAFGERHIHKLAFDRTPRFDASNSRHSTVVCAAKALLAQWDARRSLPDVQACLGPEMNMITRRKRIREALAALPAWPEVAKAAAAIYGV